MSNQQKGYQAHFLDLKGKSVIVPLPSFNLDLENDVLESDRLASADNSDGNRIYANYMNYTLVMNRETRQLIYAASNIDQRLFKKTTRKDNWRTDKRIGDDFQLDNRYYKHNVLDRGHMVMRFNAAWGDTDRVAQHSDDDTFFYSNATLQYDNLNRDEWQALEMWVHDLDVDRDDKLCVFVGPIFTDMDRFYIRPSHDMARIPTGFFKIICYIGQNSGELETKAFIMNQDEEMIADQKGKKRHKLQRYQVTVTEIERLTGLIFDDMIAERNPLKFSENDEAKKSFSISSFPESIPVDDKDEVILRRTGENLRDDEKEIRDDEVDEKDVQVKIAAAMVAPEDNPRKEWVSLINVSDEEVNLEGWTLSNPVRLATSGKTREAVIGGKLKPGESFVVQLEKIPFMLPNRGGVIKLYQKDGKLSHRVRYTKEMVKKGIPVRFKIHDLSSDDFKSSRQDNNSLSK